MTNFVIVLRGGVSYVEKCYGTIAAACEVAKAESLRYPEATVYCGSSDRTMRIVQTAKAQDGRLVSIDVRYRGRKVTSDETIPEEMWDKFNERRA